MVAVNFESVLSNQLGAGFFEWFLQVPKGRASALFVVLAGIGASLLARRGRARGASILARRAVLLLGLGYGFLYLAWEEDILHFYGYYYLLAIPCLWLPARALGVLGALLLVPTPLLLSLGHDFDKGWVLSRLEYVDLWTREGHLRHLFFNGFFSIPSWMIFFLWGMWLGRKPDPKGWIALAPKAAVFCITLELIALGLRAGFSERYFGTSFMPPVPLYVISALASSTAVLGFSCWVIERRWEGAVVRALVHTGQLALTLYLVHVVVGIGPFDIWYQLGCLSREQVFAWWAVFSYLAIVLADRYRMHFDYGPFEWLLRLLGRSDAPSRTVRGGDEA